VPDGNEALDNALGLHQGKRPSDVTSAASRVCDIQTIGGKKMLEFGMFVREMIKPHGL
jgi:hypothetical protein